MVSPFVLCISYVYISQSIAVTLRYQIIIIVLFVVSIIEL